MQIKQNPEPVVADHKRPEDHLPSFLQPQNILDSKKRSPSSADFDPTTVWIPPFEYQRLSATMKQYWDIKSQMYDKICLFKLGKFYEIFFQDAILCNWLFDL